VHISIGLLYQVLQLYYSTRSALLMDVSINVQQLEGDLGLAVVRQQLKKLDFLTIKTSTLGPTVGKGLFAARDIHPSQQGGILCFFFGKVVLCTDEEIASACVNYDMFMGLEKNIIEIPDIYNPIIYSNEPDVPSNGQSHLYLVASDCCLASFANTAGRDECNAVLKDLPPLGWDYKNGIQHLDHFVGIIHQPILCLALTRCVLSETVSFVSYGWIEVYCSTFNIIFHSSCFSPTDLFPKERRYLCGMSCLLELTE
jgi:hypothetical protein